MGAVASDAQTVQEAAVAQGQFAELVDSVVADAEMFDGAGGCGFGAGGVGLCGRGVRWQGPVGAFGVVDDGEFVEQLLQVGQGR